MEMEHTKNHSEEKVSDHKSEEEHQSNSNHVTNEHKEVESTDHVKHNKKKRFSFKKLVVGSVRKIRTNFSILALVLIVIIAILYLSQSFIDSIWLDETWYGWSGQLIQHRILHLPDLITGNNAELVANLYSVDLGYDRFFPAFVVAILNFFFVSFTSMRIMGWLFAMLGVIGTYLLGRSLKNEFTGITAMLLVATHHWFYFLSLKGLTDVAIVSMLIMFVYFLNNAVKNPSIGSISVAFIFAFLTILTKAQGLAVIPLGGAYITFIILKNWKKILPRIIEKKTYKFGAGVVLIIFVLIIFFFRRLIMAYVNTANYGLITNVFFNHVPNLLHSDIVSYAFAFGVLLAIWYRKDEYVLIALMSVILFLPIATYPGIEQRILLPIIVPIYLLGVIGLQEAGRFVNLFVKGMFKHSRIVIGTFIFLILLFGTIIPNYKVGNQLIEERRYWYSGYPEAMDWVHRNIPWNGKDLFIPNFHACCNYNVGLLNDDIRRVNNSRNAFNTDGENILGSFELFEKHVIENPNETLYVMADAWEPYQSDWHKIDLANPQKTQFNLQRLEQLGFKVVYQVKRPIPTTQGLVEIPAILIYRKN